MPSYPNNPVTAYDFRLEVCELSPSKKPELVVDIIPFVIEINIYEHLNSSYLTGNIVISDTIGLYPHIDLKGIDRVRIGVRLPDDDADSVVRTFYITNVDNSIRTNDNEYVYVVHIVEEHAFMSSNILVNDYFEGSGTNGSGTEMMQKLFRNYFGREINTQGDGGLAPTAAIKRFQEITPPTRYIAPNITPLAVAEAIRARMTDEVHTPYFLYSSFAGENVFLQSFMDILIYNSRFTRPFVFSQAHGQGQRDSLSLNSQEYNIESYSDTTSLDFSRINKMGFVNSMFYFYDVTRGIPYNPHHNDRTVSNGSVAPNGPGNHWTAYGMFNSPEIANVSGGTGQFSSGDEAIKHLYPEKAVIPWRSPDGRSDAQFNTGDVVNAQNENGTGGDVEAVHKRPAMKKIINMFASAGYTDGFNSYNENPKNTAQSNYLNLVDAHALKAWITSDPIEFIVPGRIFISRATNDTPYATTIGRIANLQFSSIEGNSIVPDLKKSGDHLLYAARHLFSATEGYKVMFTGVKVNPVSETSISSEYRATSGPDDGLRG